MWARIYRHIDERGDQLITRRLAGLVRGGRLVSRALVGLVPDDALATDGTAGGTTFLRGDRTWAIPGSGGGGGDGALTRIEREVLASAEPSITFSDIPGTFSSLKLVYTARSTASGTSLVTVNMQFNGDSGNNYDHQRLLGQAAAVDAAEQLAVNSIRFGVIAAADAPAAVASSGFVLIPAAKVRRI